MSNESTHPSVAEYLSNLQAESSRVTMKRALKSALFYADCEDDVDSFDWDSLSRSFINNVLSVLRKDDKSAATINNIRAALIGVAKVNRSRGIINADQLQDILEIKAIKKDKSGKGVALSGEQIKGILSACEKDEKRQLGLRDAAIISMLLGAGLRRAECASLSLSDLDLSDNEQGSVLVRHGKGYKNRKVYLVGGIKQRLLQWLSVRGSWRGPLFPGFAPHAKTPSKKRITDKTIFNVVYKRALEAGVLGISPHDFRRTFITELLRHSEDLFAVQDQAGHSSPETTKRYDKRGDEAKRKVARTWSISE